MTVGGRSLKGSNPSTGHRKRVMFSPELSARFRAVLFSWTSLLELAALAVSAHQIAQLPCGLFGESGGI